MHILNLWNLGTKDVSRPNSLGCVWICHSVTTQSVSFFFRYLRFYFQKAHINRVTKLCPNLNQQYYIRVVALRPVLIRRDDLSRRVADTQFCTALCVD